MASERNPYEDGIYDTPSAPQATPAANPYDTMATPISTDPGTVLKPGDKPYSTFNTVGRMATDALLGIPDTINMASRGLNYGVDRAVQAITGQEPPQTGPAIPYLAPIARKAVGIAELPEDASLKRSLAEGLGSAVMGGVGSAATRGIVRGIRAAPEVISSLNPYRPIKKITEDALAKSGENWYNTLDNLDVRYNPKTGPYMATAIKRGGLLPEGITPANASETYSNIGQLHSINPYTNVPYGTTKDYIVPRDIEGIRQALGKTRSDAARTPGSGHREGQAANIAIEGIDRFFQNTPKSAIHPSSLNDPSLVGPVLANARADTAASHRLGFLEGTRDELGTKFAAKPGASASNEAQGLRDRAAAALNASREGGGPLYGFNDYERQLLERASRASWLSKIGANAPRSPTGLVVQGIGAGASAHLAGLPTSVSSAIGVGVPAGEYVAKKLGDWGTRRAYNRAIETIAARSPLAQSAGIPLPPTDALLPASRIGREDIAAALMAQSEARRRAGLE